MVELNVEGCRDGKKWSLGPKISASSFLSVALLMEYHIIILSMEVKISY